MKEMISTFIDTTLLIQDLGVQPNDLYSFIKSVASETELQSLISLVLLCKAKDTVQVKDNLDLDSTEIKLVLRLLIDSPRILALIEELTFYITSIQLSEQSE